MNYSGHFAPNSPDMVGSREGCSDGIAFGEPDGDCEGNDDTDGMVETDGAWDGGSKMGRLITRFSHLHFWRMGSCHKSQGRVREK